MQIAGRQRPFLYQCSSFQVSYNAPGVLAHMASDGAEAWTISEPSRGEVLSRMVEAIEKWTIDTSRNIKE